MKKIILIAFFAVIFNMCVFQANAEEFITFDGYWWGTATWAQKLGYVQGFIDGYGNATKAVGEILIESVASDIKPSEANTLRSKFYIWNPYDHTFGYYMYRIDGFYKTTGSMKTPVKNIMIDLMTPMQ